MKILLIIPKYNLTNKTNYQYGFPLGLAYISSALKKERYDVDCFNLNHLNGTIEELVIKQLNKKKYEIVCSGHTGLGYTVIEKIVNVIRKYSSYSKVILGGALITSEPDLMIKSLKPDFAVIGEGEVTIIELLKEIQKTKPNFSKVDGIGYINNKKLIFTKPRKLIKDLDKLPLPDFEGFGFEERLEKAGSEAMYGAFDYPREYPILCSRGCPFQCTFCYHTLGGYRQRSIKAVINELREAIKKYRINTIEIYDDLFSIDKKRLYKFCKELKKIIKEVPWECKWTCQLSVLSIDKEMLKTLKDSGCSVASFGFESYSLKVLKSMKKPITPEQIDNAIKLALEVQIGLQGNFIFGDVAETKETAKKTLDYWKKNCKGQIMLGFIQPYPGSAIYKHCLEKGIIKDKLDFIKNKIAHTNWLNMTNKMSDKDILELKKEIVKARRKYAQYITPKIKKVGKEKYDLKAFCPFCKTNLTYKNCFIKNKFYYVKFKSCRNCNLRFFLVSPLYKFTNNHYQELDILRRNYLLIRDNFLKKKM